MIKLLDLLNEVSLPKDKWVVIPSSELKNYEDEIFSLISNAYSPIGGHPNYKSSKGVSGSESNAEYEVINLDDDPDIEAVLISKFKPKGKKFSAIGHDGSRLAKSKIINRKAFLLKQPGYFIEVSGKIEDILKAKGVEPITDEELVRKVLTGREIEWLGDGKYKRAIGGKTFTKLLMGKPKV